MITHFLNPENTEFTACGVWSFVDSIDEIKTSSDTEGITCKNCIKTKSFILNCISRTCDKIKSYSNGPPAAPENLHTPTPWFAEKVTPRFSCDARWVIYPMSDAGFIAHCGVDDDRNLTEIGANAKHIIACVNAFAGIKPTFLVKDLLKAMSPTYRNLPDEIWLSEDMRIMCHSIITGAEKK